MEMMDRMAVADLLDAARSSASGNNFSGAIDKVANARELAVDSADRSKIASMAAYIEGERSRYNEEVRIAAQKRKEEYALIAAANQKEMQRRAQASSSGYSGGYNSNYNASRSSIDANEQYSRQNMQQNQNYAREARSSINQSSQQSFRSFQSNMNTTLNREINRLSYGR